MARDRDRPSPPSNTLQKVQERRLTAAEFQGLAEVPPEAEWFANIQNEHTRRAYKRDLQDFMTFVGIERPEELRQVARAHVIAWRSDLVDRGLAPATVRRKLSAIASLYNALCEANAVTLNPVHGVARPNEGSNEGKTPAIGPKEALALLKAPEDDTVLGLRDRAILSTLLYHGLRRAELARLRVRDLQSREGVMHLEIQGKGSKIRFVALAPHTLDAVERYLEVAGHAEDLHGPLFRPTRNSRTGELERPLDPNSINRIVQKYGQQIGIRDPRFSAHSLRATAATHALYGGADVGEVRRWLGHARANTTQMYDKRGEHPQHSPTFKIDYRRRRSD